MKRRVAELLYALADRLSRLAWWLTTVFVLMLNGCKMPDWMWRNLPCLVILLLLTGCQWIDRRIFPQW